MRDSLGRFIKWPLIKLTKYALSDTAVAMLASKSKKRVWHIAMPKSGSTWTTRVIGEGLARRGWKRLYLLPASARREQELDWKQLLLKNALNCDVFLEHQHCPYSDYAVDFIRKFNVRIILQVRNIPDCLMSAIDHYNKESVVGPMAYLRPEQWARLNEEEKQRFVVDLIAPWYIRFWAGWSTVLAEPAIKCLLVKYDDLRLNPQERFKEIARFCDPDVSDDEVAQWVERTNSAGTRKNKGVGGRGVALSDAAKEQLSRFASYYRDTDFGLVGLPPH